MLTDLLRALQVEIPAILHRHSQLVHFQKFESSKKLTFIFTTKPREREKFLVRENGCFSERKLLSPAASLFYWL